MRRGAQEGTNMKQLLSSALIVLAVPALASAQAITAYEATIIRQDAPGTIAKTITAPATSVACSNVTPSIPAGGVQWLAPNQPAKIEFMVNASTTCAYTAPWSEINGLSSGVLYVATAKQINEAGLKSAGASPASNPFGVAEIPPNLLGVRVGR